MKITLRIALAAAATLTALGFSAGMSLADTFSASAGIEATTYRSDDGHLRFNALRLGVEGYVADFEYGGSIRAGVFDGYAYQSIDADLGYYFGGLIGPKATFSYADLGGLGSREALVGISGRLPVTNNIIAYGDLMTEANAFTHESVVTLGGFYRVTDNITLMGEVARDGLGGEREDRAELGVSYSVTDRINLEGRVRVTDQRGAAGVDQKSVMTGINFRF